MNIEELRSLVKLGESETLEFKTSTNEQEGALMTCCAFLNSSGGCVLIGVKNAGVIVGQEVSDNTRKRLADLTKKIEPFDQQPQVEEISIGEGKTVIALYVNEGQDKPYRYDGRAYQRIGNTTQQMPHEVQNKLSREKGPSWDSRFDNELTIDDIDNEELVRTVEAAIDNGRINEPGTRVSGELLKGLGLISKGHIRRAAVVLFGKEDRMLPNYPQCLLRLARFKGLDKAEFSDNRQYYGNAFDLLIRANRFLRDHLPIAGRVIPNIFEREDDPLYPPAALREALANAFVHRDYSIEGGSIGVAIYDDRTEITSTGRLPIGLSVTDLYRSHESIRRNPLIAEVFYQRGIIERWALGTLRIIELCESAGHPRPEFLEIGGAVIVRFRPSIYRPPHVVKHDLSERQQRILLVLRDAGPAVISEIMSQLPGEDVTARTILKDLSLLAELGLVSRPGRRGRGARWSLL